MGEIKSTLDLVMERTKHLVPTGEEREEMARRENEDAVSALIRRFLDGQVTVEGLRREVGAREASEPAFPWKDAACRECARAASPGMNHAAVLSALAALGWPGTGKLGEMVERYLAEESAGGEAASARALRVLADEGISGSSVLPNTDADAAWRAERDALREAFARERDRLAAA